MHLAATPILTNASFNMCLPSVFSTTVPRRLKGAQKIVGLARPPVALACRLTGQPLHCGEYAFDLVLTDLKASGLD